VRGSLGARFPLAWGSTPLEGKADELLLPPDHPGWLAQFLARDGEHKMVGKPEGRVDLDARARRRKAADHAGDGFTAELDRSGLENAVARCDAAFFHEGTDRSDMVADPSDVTGTRGDRFPFALTSQFFNGSLAV
jgi:hypothetical protein